MAKQFLLPAAVLQFLRSVDPAGSLVQVYQAKRAAEVECQRIEVEKKRYKANTSLAKKRLKQEYLLAKQELEDKRHAMLACIQRAFYEQQNRRAALQALTQQMSLLQKSAEKPNCTPHDRTEIYKTIRSFGKCITEICTRPRNDTNNFPDVPPALGGAGGFIEYDPS